MPDRFPDFDALRHALEEGVDYAIRARTRDGAFIVTAPHGGGIEPGSSELAEAIAGSRHSFYAFEGIRARGNAELHITSTRFDEPRLMAMLSQATKVIAVHGEASEHEGVFVGGLDAKLGERLTASLIAAGFHAAPHANEALGGLDPANLCNRGAGGAGVQLEISLGTRRTLFAALNRAGRRQVTARFHAVVAAITEVLA